MNQPQKLPTFNKLMYALGQTGWSLASFGVANMLMYFYMPPEPGDEIIFPNFISQNKVWGVFTIVGIITFLGRLFDAITDPIIAGWSDRSNFKFGRRRSFLAISALPFAILSILIFLPLNDGVSHLNAIWFGIVLVLLYFFMTMYVTPYNALITELGHNSEERLSIATYLSFTWAAGFGIGMMIYVLQGVIGEYMSSVKAFQLIMAIYAGLSFLFMLLPVIYVDENKYCRKSEPMESTWISLKEVFNNPYFRSYSLVELFYWMSTTFIVAGLSYYVTILMNLDKSYTTLVMGCVFVASIFYYYPVNRLVLKYGKKNLLLVGLIMYMITFVFISILGLFPIPLYLNVAIFVIFTAFPMAIYGIIPNALVADIADEDGQRTGKYKSATFFSIKFLLMKVGIAFANLLFPSLLLFGKSTENTLGVRLTAVAAFLICLISYSIMKNYKELPKSHSN
jgi:Na+/melibiose symporter-like transporter